MKNNLLQTFIITSLASGVFCTAALATEKPATTLQPKSSQQALPLDKVVAVVNSDVVTQSELNHVEGSLQQLAQSQGASNASADVVRQHALDLLIDQKLQLQLASRMGVKVTSEQLDKTLDNIAKQNKLSRAEFKQKMENAGMNYQIYRQDLSNQYTVQMVQQQVLGAQVHLDAKEVKRYIAELKTHLERDYQLQDNLFAYSNEKPSEQEIKQTMNAARSWWAAQKAGKDSTYINPQSEDLGWKKTAELPALFLEAVKNLEVGQSKILAAPNGVHVLVLQDARPAAQQQPLPDREQAEQMLYQKKMAEVSGKWLKMLREHAYVQVIG